MSSRKTTKSTQRAQNAKNSKKAKNRRRMVTALAVTAGLLAAGGAGHRMLADYLGQPTDSVPMSTEELNRLPYRIGEWIGKDVPLPKDIIDAIGADAVLNRSYSRGGIGRPVGLLVAYGVRTRAMMPHRPEVCYPGTGHAMQSNETHEVELTDGTKLPCTVYVFTRGGAVGDQTTTVLNYYVVDGRYTPDVSGIRWKPGRGSGGVRYVAQVQIVCSGGGGTDLASSERTVQAFAADVTPPIRALFPETRPAAGAATDNTRVTGS